ncbi:hypothetical protein ACFL2X_01025 [Candidatus Latescibacterota bacterium]
MKKLSFAAALYFMFVSIAAFATFATFVSAQAPDYSQLDPKPYDPATDPNIDMFISHWSESMPRHTHGSLIERDILTRSDSDPLKPEKRGAVLKYLSKFTFASLAAKNSTTPNTLSGEQYVFYVVSGMGKISAGGQTGELFDGVGVLMPSGIEYTITNLGDSQLNMYIIGEQTTADFVPNKEMLVRDENVMPINYSSGHWSNIHTQLFRPGDGFSTISGMGPVWYAPMTICQPHTHSEGNEECWFALEGDITVLLGKQIRKLPPGTGFKNPPSGKHPYGPINNTDSMIKLFYVGAPISKH